MFKNVCIYNSKNIYLNFVIHVSLQTSLSFLQSQPQWRFRSFATMSLICLFSPFPMTIKKTPAASLTFNPRWSRKQMCKQHNATKHFFFFAKTKMEGKKTAVIVSWQFVDSIANLNPECRRLQINPILTWQRWCI